MRRAVGAPLPLLDIKLTSTGCHRCALHCLLFCHWRQNTRQSSRQHGLPSAWRTYHQNTVAAGRRHFERALDRRLTTNIRPIQRSHQSLSTLKRRDATLCVTLQFRCTQFGAHLEQRGRRPHTRLRHQCRLSTTGLRQHHDGRRIPQKQRFLRQTIHHCQSTLHRTQLARKRQLPSELISVHIFNRQLATGHQNTERNRQIKTTRGFW